MLFMSKKNQTMLLIGQHSNNAFDESTCKQCWLKDRTLLIKLNEILLDKLADKSAGRSKAWVDLLSFMRELPMKQKED